MRIKKIVKFYNETSPVEKVQLLWMMADQIMIPIKKEDGTHCLELDKEVPVCMNGSLYQFNTEELFTEEKDKKKNSS
tara:strand:+ start:1219 stop:1449 length:231 start_codon:yes stop_codon:yes gene_type:complete